MSEKPDCIVRGCRAELENYLLSHIQVVSDGNAEWPLRLTNIELRAAEQVQSGVFQEAVAVFSMTPPAGMGTRAFTLRYDVIMHQVVTHKAVVSIRRDWAGGLAGGEPVAAGVIRVDTGTTRIEPLAIRLGEGGWRAGFLGMAALGMEHVRGGADHMLFLLVLMLPAIPAGRLRALVKLVTAFTLGHSLTLPAGALGWVNVPQQPVEVFIALSIFVSAIHAIRPVFPGREIYVAAGFGLIHGLAFAAGLAELELGAGAMAVSILGFNLGIELMQLFVVAVTAPWLFVLSRTPAYPWLQCGGGALAAVASLGWMATRISGEMNPVAQAVDALAKHAPLGVLLLALFALAAYLGDQIRQTRMSTEMEG